VAVKIPDSGYVFVVDLNKCIGCQACAVACKVWWKTDQYEAPYIWWRIVETRPGPGYPKNWLNKKMLGLELKREDYEPEAKFRYENLFNNKESTVPPRIYPLPIPQFGPNWDWDKGEGNKPEDAWFFYLPMACMHCDNPACLRVCPMPGTAIIKLPEGPVLVNPEFCGGCMQCVQACPYARMFFSFERKKASHCIMCAPLLERGEPPVCVRTCPQRAIYFGRIDDPASPVYVLAKEYKVALPLLPVLAEKHEVVPRVLYIPPVLTPPKPDGTPRYDEKYMDLMFGPDWRRVKQVLEQERAKGPKSKLMQVLTMYPTWKL